MKIVKPPKKFTFECERCLAIIEFSWDEVDELGMLTCPACGEFNQINDFEPVQDE
jgi:hypothetical protein